MLIISNKEFNRLATYIKTNYGINLTEKKKALVEGRLRGILQQKNIRNFSDYYDYIVADNTGEAVITLINKITTNHTFFMREPEHFRYFSDTVLPYWAGLLEGEKDIRVWSAGCSSGQEPYTLAMIMSDFFGLNKRLWDTRILATDISMQVVKKALDGIYPNEQIINLPNRWRRQYFKEYDEDNSMVMDNIKNDVIFRMFNLVNCKFPFKKKFHIIFCRNVMIYFDNKTKMELVNKFYDCTEPGGFLFIGHSESLNRQETKYKYVMPAVYRKE
ncbi:MAG: protein-glutamate O-methyltransferase CheR [Clostridium sp.]|nr:protein-glutamate O-methyltransferase CheR [Clostridium sp.]